MKQKVKWQYTHHLNNRSSLEGVKEGEYYGQVKHTVKHWDKIGAKQMAVVQFDRNKKPSIVPYEELIFITSN